MVTLVCYDSDQLVICFLIPTRVCVIDSLTAYKKMIKIKHLHCFLEMVVEEADKFASEISSYDIGHAPVTDSSAMSSSNNEGRQCEDLPPLKLTKMDTCFMRLNKQQQVRGIAQPQETTLHQLNNFLRSTASSDFELDTVEFWNLRQTTEKYPDLPQTGEYFVYLLQVLQ